MKILDRQLLYVISSFLAGLSVMTVELVSSRIVAPIIGSSVFTWTSVIGTTLLGLAFGSFVGGHIADKSDPDKALPLSFLISSAFVALIPTLAGYTDFITTSSDSIAFLNLALSVYLFFLPTFAIGFIQPIILKKFANDFSKISSSYGILSLAWSAGGILGVFLTGFLFISLIGSQETMWLMAFILFITGIIFGTRNKRIILCFIFTMVIVGGLIILVREKSVPKQVVYEKETDYYNAKVIDAKLPFYGNSRILTLDFDFHSIQPEKKVEDYPEMHPVFGDLKKDIQNILVIGAGAYTLPKNLKSYYKKSSVSVVEIDPEMVKIGNNYFDLKKYDINTIVGDAKVVIKKSREKYDVIFGDAYNSFISVPWYLLTKEWNEEVRSKLNENGLYAINFIGSLTGPKSEFTTSVLNTFKITFPNYYIFAFGGNPENLQNIVFIGVNGDLPLTEESLWGKLSEENNFLKDKMVPRKLFENVSSTILTDDFSPVEKLMQPIMKDYFPKNLFQLKTILSSHES